MRALQLALISMIFFAFHLRALESLPRLRTYIVTRVTLEIAAISTIYEIRAGMDSIDQKAAMMLRPRPCCTAASGMNERQPALERRRSEVTSW